MSFLYRNIAVIHVFLVLAVFAWLFGGTRGEFLLPTVPWLVALLLEGMICFPQRHAGETSYEARERVWEDIRRDPLTWVSVGFLLLLTIPFFNHGLCPICDYPAIIAGENPEPTFPVIPFCVDRIHHLNVVLWFVPALTAVIAVKHALVKSGKRLLVEMLVWNGVALAVIGAVQQMTNAVGPLWCEAARQDAYFFSTFGYPNMAGDYFTTLFGFAVGLWRWRRETFEAEQYEAEREERSAHHQHSHSHAGEGERKEGENQEAAAAEVKVEGHRHHHHGGDRKPRKARTFWVKNYHLIAAVILFVAAVNTLSRASIMLVTMLGIVFYLHSFFGIFAKMKKVLRVKYGMISLVVLGVVSTTVIMNLPEDVGREIKTIDTTGVLDRMTGKGQYHVRVATEIWKDNFLFGVGGWGYKHFCLQYMTDTELKQIQKVGGINVHNDYLQFLAEHGLVGFGTLVAIVILLIWPLGRVWKALIESIRFVPKKDLPPQPASFFVLPAPVFCILMTLISTFIHGFGDCILRSPAVLTLFLVSLAVMDGYLPRIRREHDHS